MVILQFAFPFLTLLSRAAKQSAQRLGMLALLILIMRVVDVIWLIEPTEHFHFSWMDIVAPIAIGGVWIATFAWQLQKRSLVPINDPQLEQALTAHAGH